MPRNGSGVYSPTAGVPVTSGTTISSTAINNVLDDLGDEITASLPVSGVAPMTGVFRATLGTVAAPGIAFVGDTNTGIYSPGADQIALATNGTVALTISATQTTTWAAAATFSSTTTFTGAATFSAKTVGKAFDVDAITSVASATTTDIGAAATSEVLITGTTTITGFGTSNAGIRRRGRFEGILTLTHNGTSLILPGAANITTAANDRFEALSLGSGNWIVTDYTRSSGSPLAIAATQLPNGTIIDRSYAEYTANTSLSTTTPFDDTVPAVSEGTQVLSASITPKTTTNRVRIRIAGSGSREAGATGLMTVAVHINGAAAAYAFPVECAETTSAYPFAGEYEYVPGSTSAQTITVRVGVSSGGCRLNGTGGGRLYGGTARTTLVLEEIASA